MKLDVNMNKSKLPVKTSQSLTHDSPTRPAGVLMDK